jgi:molybdopterin converting factor small subunit
MQQESDSDVLRQGQVFRQLFEKSHNMMHSLVAGIVREWITLLSQKEKELEGAAERKKEELSASFKQKEMELQEWENNLRQRENALERRMRASRQIAKAAEDKVWLNVGGTEFLTTKATLLSEQDTFFSAMLCSGAWKPDEHGQFFIDRDPKYFADVLNYLRLGQFHLDMDHMTAEDRECVFEELDFYQLEKAVTMLGRQTPSVRGPVTFDPARCTQSIAIAMDRSQAAYLPDSPTHWAAVYLDLPSDDCSFSFTSTSHNFILVSHDFASLDFPLWPRNLQCFLAGYGTHWTPYTKVPEQTIYTVTIRDGKYSLSGCGPALPMHGADLLFFFKHEPTAVRILPDRYPNGADPSDASFADEDDAEALSRKSA